MTLTFDTLRRANLARLPLFKNSKGEPAHSEPDGSDWSLGEWCTAVLGELGEAANIIKKIKRGDISLDEARTALAKEFADATVYLDILAYQADIDLGAAVWAKWDEVSERIEIDLRIAQFKQPKDLNTLVAERIRSEHTIGYEQWADGAVVFNCSCKAVWKLVLKKDQDVAEQIRESMRSHHISAGLKPSEVL
jgi:NTP pyrophosphatase (non-canonical NTP hydrolase)